MWTFDAQTQIKLDIPQLSLASDHSLNPCWYFFAEFTLLQYNSGSTNRMIFFREIQEKLITFLSLRNFKLHFQSVSNLFVTCYTNSTEIFAFNSLKKNGFL